MQNNRLKGSIAEDYACDYLLSQGYQIIDRNWHFSNRGEIDIVAKDPKRFGEEYLVFIEVKSRDYSFEDSLHALSQAKQKQVKKLIPAYLKAKALGNDINISFDFIAIHKDKIEHIKDVF